MVTTGLSRGVINSRIGRIKRVFRWAVSEQLAPPSLVVALDTVMGLQRGRTAARETKPVMPISDEVVEKTLPCLPDVVADMVRIQRLSHATKSTSDSISADVNATFRASRSSLATTSVAFDRRQWPTPSPIPRGPFACRFRLPGTQRELGLRDLANPSTADRWASRPSPELPWALVETRM